MESSKDFKIYTVPEVARFLRISRCRAYSMAKKGVIPSIRVGRCVRIPSDLFEKWLSSDATRQVK